MKGRVIDPEHDFYLKVGTIRNCIESEGELYYIMKFKFKQGLYMIHESRIEIL